MTKNSERLGLVYDPIEDPCSEDEALIRAVFPEAQAGYPGLFIIEGDYDQIATRLGVIDGWRLIRENFLSLAAK